MMDQQQNDQQQIPQPPPPLPNAFGLTVAVSAQTFGAKA